jgi:hypothetical protein
MRPALLLFALTILSLPSLVAQAPTPTLLLARCGSSNTPLLIVDGVIVDGCARTASRAYPTPQAALRDLVTAQEGFWAQHGTYTTDVSQLGMFRPFKKGEIQDSIWVEVLFAGGRSWSAEGGYRGKGRVTCVIYVGRLSDFPSPPVTPHDSLRATEEAAPVCDKS